MMLKHYISRTEEAGILVLQNSSKTLFPKWWPCNWDFLGNRKKSDGVKRVAIQDYCLWVQGHLTNMNGRVIKEQEDSCP